MGRRMVNGWFGGSAWYMMGEKGNQVGNGGVTRLEMGVCVSERSALILEAWV